MTQIDPQVPQRGWMARATRSTLDRSPAGADVPGLVQVRRVAPPRGLVTREQHLADLREQLAAYTAAGLLAMFDNADIARLLRIVEIDGLGDFSDVPLADVFAAVRDGHAGLPGFAFEWAVHIALNRGRGSLPSRLREETAQALSDLRLPGSRLVSVMLGGSQAEALGYTELALDVLGEHAVLRYGGTTGGRPAKLSRALRVAADVSRRRLPIEALPRRVTGLVGADLLVGFADTGHMVAATCKYGRDAPVEWAPSVRLAFVPADTFRMRPGSNPVSGESAVVLELPFDDTFLQPFRLALQLVRALRADGLSVAAHARALGTQEQQELARELVRRRNRSLSSVLAWLEERAQVPLRSGLGTADLGVSALVSDLGIPLRPVAVPLVADPAWRW